MPRPLWLPAPPNFEFSNAGQIGYEILSDCPTLPPYFGGILQFYKVLTKKKDQIAIGLVLFLPYKLVKTTLLL